MFDRIQRHLRMAATRRRVEQAVREGAGLHRRTWLLVPADHGGAREATTAPTDGAAEASLAAIGGEVVDWCRERMAEARRPYGIDQVALALACAEPGGAVVASRTFGVFRPLDFYRPGGLDADVAAFVRSLPRAAGGSGDAGGVADAAGAAGAGPGTPLRIAAALLSWGDLADAVTPGAAHADDEPH